MSISECSLHLTDGSLGSRDIVDTLAPRETYDYKPLARAVILAVFAKNIASFNHEDADGNRMGDSSPEELLDISDN